jgi:hypothetical protein
VRTLADPTPKATTKYFDDNYEAKGGNDGVGVRKNGPQNLDAMYASRSGAPPLLLPSEPASAYFRPSLYSGPARSGSAPPTVEDGMGLVGRGRHEIKVDPQDAYYAYLRAHFPDVAQRFDSGGGALNAREAPLVPKAREKVARNKLKGSNKTKRRPATHRNAGRWRVDGSLRTG